MRISDWSSDMCSSDLSCALIALGSFMDADASNLTRPANLFLSQAMIAFAAIYFIGPTMMAGMLRAIVNGPSHLVSFSAVFGISQTLGGIDRKSTRLNSSH